MKKPRVNNISIFNPITYLLGNCHFIGNNQMAKIISLDKVLPHNDNFPDVTKPYLTS